MRISVIDVNLAAAPPSATENLPQGTVRRIHGIGAAGRIEIALRANAEPNFEVDAFAHTPVADRRGCRHTAQALSPVPEPA